MTPDGAAAVDADNADDADPVGPRAPAEDVSDLAEPTALRGAVEAVLFVVDSPVAVATLASGLNRPVADVEAALSSLADELDARASGVELRRVAGGVRLYTRPDVDGWVQSFLLDGQRGRLSQAGLETLAIIAYRQPVARARISAIRGVNVDSVVRSLTARGLVAEDGADPDTGAGLYRTTALFLERMGLAALDELPSLAPLLPTVDGTDLDDAAR